MPTSRRAILALATVLALSAPAEGQPVAAPAAGARVLRIRAVVPAGAPAPVLDGLRFGAEEAQRSAALFGWTVQLILAELRDGDTLDGLDSLHSLHSLDSGDVPEAPPGAGPVHAWIVAGDEASCARLAQRAQGDVTVPMLTVGCTADALRTQGCSAFVFHVSPSSAMRAAAREAAGNRGASGRVVAWDSTLVRYGAAQVNDRFRARFGRGAGETEWAAWLAVKAITEAAVRAGTNASGALRSRLAAATLDGHKGLPLSFRPWDGQLRQPLYIMDATTGAAPQELPVRERGIPARALLDRLAGTPPATPCRTEPAR